MPARIIHVLIAITILQFPRNGQCSSAWRRREELRKEEHGNRGRWVFAETVKLSEAQALLPAHHPELDDPYAWGLPQDCLTYEERYQKYRTPSDELLQLNDLIPDSKYVALLRTYPGMYWSEDLVYNIRALAHEVHSAGWHFWLYQQDTIVPDKEVTGNPVAYMSHVPLEFRPLVLTFTAQELHSEYPLVHKYRVDKTGSQTDFQWRDYLGATMFLQRYSSYDFAFVIESDVRYTGKDWGVFFNSVMHIAQHAISDSNSSTPEKATLESLPSDAKSLPDMILFAPTLYGAEAASPSNTMSDYEHWKFPNIIKHFTTMYGLSRKMQSNIVKHSRQGFGSFIEQFLPSVAYHEDVNTVTVSLGSWNHSHPLHCCMPQIPLMYEQWFTQGQCLASIPLHPIKNRLNKGLWKEYLPAPGLSSSSCV